MIRPADHQRMDTFSAALTLFLVMDPLGNIPVFLAVLEQVAPARRRLVLVREMAIALGILVAFLYGGPRLLDLLGLEPESIRIAGGIVLFLIALRMVFPHEGAAVAEPGGGEPLVVPLAVPLIAGPSTLATLLLLVRSAPERRPDWLLALGGAWILSAAILMGSTALYRLLGKRGLQALERLMGMLLVMLAVQMFLDGARAYLGAGG